MKRVRCYYHKPDPPNTRRCTRPGKFGNDFKIGEVVPIQYYGKIKHRSVSRNSAEFIEYVTKNIPINSTEEAIYLYKTYQLPTYTDDDLRELLQYDNLACFCKPENPCHVDALIDEIKRRKLS